jgi:hypothetical protein
VRVIIAGSRDIILNVSEMDEIVRASGFNIDCVVCGMARGVDASGLRWAEARSVLVDRFPAEWSKWGTKAGPIRNRDMAANADALIAVTNGSKGTEHMIRVAAHANLKVFVKRQP